MEGIDPNLVFLWRAVERFANVLIGAATIYLGDKLFMNLPEHREEKKGELKLMLPGDISVYVSRVGPGVFFALFGTAVVLMSFVSSLQLDRKGTAELVTVSETSPGAGASLSISHVSGKPETDRFGTDRAAVRRDLVALRAPEEALNAYIEIGRAPQIGVNEANTLLNILHRVKRSLLLGVWDDSWLDAERFARWVQEGAFGPPPLGLEKVATMLTLPLKEDKP